MLHTSLYLTLGLATAFWSLGLSSGSRHPGLPLHVSVAQSSFMEADVSVSLTANRVASYAYCRTSGRAEAMP